MTEGERKLERIHPAVILIYYVIVIGCMIIQMNPVITAVSFLGSGVFSFALGRGNRRKGRLGTLLFFLVCAAVNPLISHNGRTVLFFLNQKAITLEAILYGLLMSLTFLTTLFWSTHMTFALSGDKIMYLIGRISKKAALMISMIFKLIPEYGRQAVAFRENQRQLGLYGDSLMEKMKASGYVFSGMLTWALEHSMETADSIRGRGYGITGRTQYHDYRMGYRDCIFLMIEFLAAVVMTAALCEGLLTTEFYPNVVLPGLKPEVFAVYITYILLVMGLPCYLLTEK